MAFFDFHCHPFFKPVWITGDRQQALATNLTFEIDPAFKPGIATLLLRAFGQGLINLLNSQSSFRQIQDGSGAGGSIIVANLIAMENAYANLGFCFFNNVFQRLTNVNRGQLNELGNSQIGYAEMVSREWDLARQFANQDLNGVRYKLINTFAEADLTGNVINVIIALEGGHCFYERPDVAAQEQHPAEVVNALREWKRQTALGQRPRLFYITLTHHTTNCLTNHAFAVPTGLAGDGTNTVAGGFNPTGNGLTDAGREFIRVALNASATESRVLIDVKHLSLRARLEFYEMRRQLIAAGHPPFPIVASHIGVAGLALDDAVVVVGDGCRKFAADDACFEVEYVDIERLHGFAITSNADPNQQRLRFNPSSVNLFDEEIHDIVESGGLIGFSFDSRILGNEGADTERFSKQEVTPGANLFPLRSIATIDFDTEMDNGNGHIFYPSRNRNQFTGESRYPDSPFFNLPFTVSDTIKKHTDLMALCQNIVHAVRVGGPDTWNCICIGSDYDGIINSIDFAPVASDIPGMEGRFRLYITRMVTALNAFFDQENSPEARIVIPADFYELFIIENAKRFLAAHFV